MGLYKTWFEIYIASFSKRALHFQSGWCQGMGSGCPEAPPWPRAAVECAKCICQAASLPCWTHQMLSSSPLTQCFLLRSSSLAWTFVKVQKKKKKKYIFNSGCLMGKYVLHAGLVATFSWPYFPLLMQLTPRARWQGGWLWDSRVGLSNLNFRITEK